MNTRLDELAKERERLIVTIADQRRQLQRSYASTRDSLSVSKRVRETTRYLVTHRVAVWSMVTLITVVMRVFRSRRRPERKARSVGAEKGDIRSRVRHNGQGNGTGLPRERS